MSLLICKIGWTLVWFGVSLFLFDILWIKQ